MPGQPPEPPGGNLVAERSVVLRPALFCNEKNTYVNNNYSRIIFEKNNFKPASIKRSPETLLVGVAIAAVAL
jgi:hypothetical protein